LSNHLKILNNITPYIEILIMKSFISKILTLLELLKIFG